MAMATAKAESKKPGWLGQHAAGEKFLASELLTFFSAQRKRVVASLEEMGGNVTPAILDLVFRPLDEHQAFMEAIADPLVTLMATGAVNELAAIAEQQAKAAAAGKAAKEYVPDPLILEGFNLPPRVRAAISLSFGELTKQDYWQQIQSTTRENLVTLVQGGIEEGWSGWKMRSEINKAMGGLAKVRAAAIARTETTGAMNAGHQGAYGELVVSGGGAVSKEWLAIVDEDTRDNHIDLHGVQVAVNEDFDVGGYEVPYPGHHSLPAGERVNCRCTTVAVF